ncbi:adenylate isopentenyltransferase 5, chloroplastic [Ricinus communis]|uniref:adenylate dimethylallyltransferase (ADP/ATP-dependent) n=1 Tax=Ricinus communis TaxID=3988 RepID=B9RZD0_RICCO|nr:adenylate isopentenyltransferase 5, chloroplastic [Ricinus communis]EEF43310.1 ATP binding protein, putative [Ricinus communis]|eukprot:XP_002519099.1 adenylate isopentenyltransferase 5, chloroplastic [Ricinus communis]
MPVAARTIKTTNGTQESHKKKKVVFILGATGTGKTKLSIDLATHYKAEIINSDKIQVYHGLDIVTNKATEAERKGIPHHLLGFLQDPEADFTIRDFCIQVHRAINHIINDNGCTPIVVGGSNTYIKALVEDDESFKGEFDACFLWMDVELSVLYKRVSKRIDQMVDAGLVDEIRGFFAPGIDYSKGVWRAIGVPEMEKYFLAEKNMADETTKRILLDAAIQETKENTCKLVNSQIAKINMFRKKLGWKLHRLNATSVFEKAGIEADDAWKKMVLNPSLKIVGDFLGEPAY